MSVVGDFTVPAEAFALEHALSAVPEMTVEATRLASHSPREVFPLLWATDGDFDAFADALAEDASVTEVSIGEQTESEVLYRLEWAESFRSLVHEIVDHHAVILDASARDDQWNLRLRFAEEEMMSAFQDHFRETDHRFEVNQLYYSTAPRQRAFDLTAEQHEALVTAVEKGYFDVPRAASTKAVSEALGILTNAVSERVRRGCETLVRSALSVPGDGDGVT